ncbi:hypothetical protein D3C76_937260 [compost metagenome]
MRDRFAARSNDDCLGRECFPVKQLYSPNVNAFLALAIKYLLNRVMNKQINTKRSSLSDQCVYNGFGLIRYRKHAAVIFFF